MILAIIQARHSSTRLPGKALAAIAGRPMLQHVIDRTLAIRQVDNVVLALPGGDEEHALWSWAVSTRMPGSRFGVRRVCDVAANDVLARYVAVAAGYEAETIVRITGDCPLLAPEIADAVIAMYLSTPGVEYASNVVPGYIDGTDVEIFSADALRWSARQTRDQTDREHVTTWLRRNIKSARIDPLEDRSHLKLSVDTAEDLAYVRAIARRLKPGDYRLATTLAAAATVDRPGTRPA